MGYKKRLINIKKKMSCGVYTLLLLYKIKTVVKFFETSL